MAKDLILSHQQCDSWGQRAPIIIDSSVTWRGHAGHQAPPSSTRVLGCDLGQGLPVPSSSWL